MKKIICIMAAVLAVGLAVAAAGVGIYRYREYKKYEPFRNDCARIAEEEYNTVFFSTFPVNGFLEEDYIHYRALYPVISSYVIPDMETMNDYFQRVAQTVNEVETVYLGVRPDIVTAQDLMELMNEWPQKRFEVLLAYPSLDYWAGLKEDEYPEKLEAYRRFIYEIMPLFEDEENEWIRSNLSVYFYGETEWLVGNRANYDSDFGANAGISHMIAMYTDPDHGYMLTTDNYEEKTENFSALVDRYRQLHAVKKAGAKKAEEEPREEPVWETGEDFDPEECLSLKEYPDLAKWDVVFFGDSIIAFEETSSVPGAFEGFTGAHTYNCARGGSSAYSFPAVADALIGRDLGNVEEGTQVYRGLEDYIQHSKKKRRKCFVIDFGMNDYYGGHRVRNAENPYDAESYAGALRIGVEKLREAFPDSVILLMTPNFTNYFQNGEEPQSDIGGSLSDYVEAVVALGGEYGLPVYNCYEDLGIDVTNWTEYLLDGTHPNEPTRYAMGSALAQMMEEYGGKK